MLSQKSRGFVKLTGHKRVIYAKVKAVQAVDLLFPGCNILDFHVWREEVRIQFDRAIKNDRFV